LQVINGKVRLISDLFCDGLGACIGHCPQGAISIEKRESEPYDESRVMENIVKGGTDVITAHLRHLKEHGQDEYLRQALEVLKQKNVEVPLQEPHGHQAGQGGCPGSRMMDMRQRKEAHAPANVTMQSELSQWPVQLHLLNPAAPYLKNAELVIAADCVAFAYANFHQKFLKGKMLAIFCPKLDDSHEQYIEKLAKIFKRNDIKSVSVVHMEVPCCFGTVNIVQEAVERAGKSMAIKEYTVSINGELI
jgi:ferredoxin